MPSVKKSRGTLRRAHSQRRQQSSLFPRLPLRTIKMGALMVAVVIVISSIVWFFKVDGTTVMANKVQMLTDAGMRQAGLQISGIMVEGRQFTSVATLQKVIGHQRGDLIIDVSPLDLKKRLETLPWIRSAIVQRQWPSTLYIRLTEQYPIALWQKGTQYHLIDDQGHVIAGHDLKNYGSLPILTGDNAPAEAPALIDVLQHFPQVRKRMTGAILVGKRRWDLVINGKVTVKLPEHDIQDELAQLTELLQSTNFNDDDILFIDLRTANRAYFHLSDDAIKRKKPPTDKKT